MKFLKVQRYDLHTTHTPMMHMGLDGAHPKMIAKKMKSDEGFCPSLKKSLPGPRAQRQKNKRKLDQSAQVAVSLPLY